MTPCDDASRRVFPERDDAKRRVSNEMTRRDVVRLFASSRPGNMRHHGVSTAYVRERERIRAVLGLGKRLPPVVMMRIDCLREEGTPCMISRLKMAQAKARIWP